jgi:hypothetical protein
VRNSNLTQIESAREKVAKENVLTEEENIYKGSKNKQNEALRNLNYSSNVFMSNQSGKMR